MEKLYTSKTFLKMAGGRMHTSHPTPLAIATETIERVWHILVTWHHQFCNFSPKGRVKKGGHGTMPPPKHAFVSTFGPTKVLMVDFQKKVFVVRDEAPYFFEALGLSLPSLMVNPALTRSGASDSSSLQHYAYCKQNNSVSTV